MARTLRKNSFAVKAERPWNTSAKNTATINKPDPFKVAPSHTTGVVPRHTAKPKATPRRMITHVSSGTFGENLSTGDARTYSRTLDPMRSPGHGHQQLFLMWAGHIFAGGVRLLPQNYFKIVDSISRILVRFTPKTISLFLFFLGAGMVGTDYYYVLV